MYECQDKILYYYAYFVDLVKAFDCVQLKYIIYVHNKTFSPDPTETVEHICKVNPPLATANWRPYQSNSS